MRPTMRSTSLKSVPRGAIDILSGKVRLQSVAAMLAASLRFAGGGPSIVVPADGVSVGRNDIPAGAPGYADHAKQVSRKMFEFRWDEGRRQVVSAPESHSCH